MKTPLNRYTFSNKRIRRWVEDNCEGLTLNLFAGKTPLSVNEIRVDSNPDMPAIHMDALEFVKRYKDVPFNTVILDPPYCYDDQTEILTDCGWKYFKELKEETVATLNPKTHLLEYQKPTEIIDRNYNGEMIDIKSTSINLTVTPNHELYVRKLWKSNKYKFIRAGEIDFGFEFKSNCKWVGKEEKHFILPEVLFENHNRYGKTKAPSKKIKMNSWLRFLGVYLADGCVDPSGKNYRTRIAKQKQPDRDIVEKIIQDIGFHYIIEKGGFTIYNKQLCVYLRQFKKTKEKFIPKNIKNLCSEQLEILLDHLILCDGHKSRKKVWSEKYKKYYTDSHLSYCSVSKRLIDDVSEICLKTGRVAIQKEKHKDTKTIYTLTITEFRLTPMISKKLLSEYVKKINYNGKIYCVTVPNHIVYVRKNGRPCWCGNSYRKSMEMYHGHVMSPFKRLKDEIPNILKPGGIVITLGYHSISMGVIRGFEIEQILLMSHGGAIHDTIATMERKK